jgi:hypothetical protein
MLPNIVCGIIVAGRPADQRATTVVARKIR